MQFSISFAAFCSGMSKQERGVGSAAPRWRDQQSPECDPRLVEARRCATLLAATAFRLRLEDFIMKHFALIPGALAALLATGAQAHFQLLYTPEVMLERCAATATTSSP